MAVRQKRVSGASSSQLKSRAADKEQDVMVQIAQELYRVVLFAVFMVQTSLAGLVPGVGEQALPFESPLSSLARSLALLLCLGPAIQVFLWSE